MGERSDGRVTDDFQARFGGVARLYGVAALERLARSRVAVIGLGGVGSWTVEALARTGVGALTLIDLDDVCVTNVNRQLPALTSTVGRPKAEVLAERVREINPGCRVEAVTEFFTAASADRLLAPGFDVVVDAVDRMSVKALVISKAEAAGAAVVTMGSAGGRRQATQVRVDDFGRAGSDELLRQVRRKLRRDHGYAKGENQIYGIPCVFTPEPPVFPRADGTCSTEPEPGTSLKMDCSSGYGAAAHVTGVFGLLAAGAVVDRLVNG